MTRMDPAQPVTVFDRDGVRGTAPAEALRQADGQVLITFGAGQSVHVPVSLLRLRTDGSYDLPLRLREVVAATAVRPLHTSAAQDAEGTVMAVVPVVVEEAQVSTRELETGRVRIQKTVHRTEEQVDVPLLRDQVHVERVPVERYLEKPLEPRYEGDTLVIPVMEEVLVVQKRLRLREEIRVTTVRERTAHQETVILQREEVTVTRQEPTGNGVARQG